MKVFFLLIITLWSVNLMAQSNSAMIRGKFVSLKDNDSVVLQIYKNQLFNKEADILKIAKKVRNGTFTFNISLAESPVYVNLTLPHQGDNIDGSKNLYGFLIERGDIIEYSGRSAGDSSGPGSRKWIIQNELIQIDKCLKNKRLYAEGPSGITDQFKVIDSAFTLKLKLLLRNKKVLGNVVTTSLIADNLSSSRILKTLTLRNAQVDKKDIANILSHYKDIGTVKYFTIQDSLTVFPRSISFCDGVIAKYRLDSCFRKNELFSVSKCYYSIKDHYSGLLKEKLLITLLYNYRNSPEDISDCLNDATKLITASALKEVLESLKTSGFKDAEVYKFTLSDTSDNKVLLSDFKGKIVLLDFWFTGCPACMELSEKLRQLESKIDLKSVVLLSINTDQNKSKWIGSVRGGRYTSPHAINLNTGVLGNKHPLIKHYLITAYPTLLVFNQKGNRMRNPQNPLSDNGEDLLSLLKY